MIYLEENDVAAVTANGGMSPMEVEHESSGGSGVVRWYDMSLGGVRELHGGRYDIGLVEGQEGWLLA